MSENLKVHYIQHVPFEPPAGILTFLKEKRISISKTLLYKNDNFPDLKKFDILFIMGGPMGVHDENRFSWLKEEKEFIEKAIKMNKTIIGICLGAQLIADVLGARVYRNRYKEIGWFEVEMEKEILKTKTFKGFPEKIVLFHWHGDTFDIPENSIKIGKSEATENQGFIFKNKVIGLQFHLEVTEDSVRKMIENGKNELKKDRYIQTPEQIFGKKENFIHLSKLLNIFLNNLLSSVKLKTD